MPRVKELDFLKGVLILLVISFHLVWFEQLHPDLKQVVYCFHMPGFLLISGYLMNINKTPRQFLRTLLWLAVPYLVMESGYIYMASLLPINEHIANLTPAVFLDRLFLHPLGPYWYLHALILCGAVYYIIYRYGARSKEQGAGEMSQQQRTRGNLLPLAPCSLLLLTGIAYYVLSHICGILSFSSSLYFLAGAMLRQRGSDFLSFFSPTKLAVVAFILLACFTKEPTQGSLTGALIVYFAISSLLWLYKGLGARGREQENTDGPSISPAPCSLPLAPFPLLCFLGRNSLMLYVFSPIFTVLCKQFVPYLKFDPTGLLFLIISLAVCVGGSLLIAWLMDFVGISKYFFGRRALN